MLPPNGNIYKDFFYAFTVSRSSGHTLVWMLQNGNDAEHIILYLDFMYIIEVKGFADSIEGKMRRRTRAGGAPS